LEIKSGEKLDLVVVVVIWRRDLLKNSKGVRVAAAFTAAFCSLRTHARQGSASESLPPD